MLVDAIKQFHFIEPLWLLGLIPAVLIVWQLFKHRSSSQSAWKKVIDTKFLPYLLVKQAAGQQTKLPLFILIGVWILTAIAMANPTWQRLPQPVVQELDAQVIVLDLSAAMLAKDIKPSRLQQAKYKIEDILRHSQEKQTGLVVYSGDAFTVTPLTDDMATLKSQLSVLEPSLMPAPGNRPDLGLQQAGKLLKQAGYQQGHIILIAESAGNTNTTDIAKELAKTGYQVSLLGMGTTNGALIPGVQNRNGRPVLSKIDHQALEAVSHAGNGVYAPYSSNLNDVKQILQASSVSQPSAINSWQTNTKKKQAERWVENGPWLAVLLLPLSLLGFRRGWFLALPFMLLGPLFSPQPVMASAWDALWQRPDQRAAVAFDKQDYAAAAAIADQSEMQGAASYRAGNYQQAIKSFSQKKDADSHYNLGNTLAKTGDYKKSLNAYDDALKQQPQMQDAIENRQLVADLLKQEEEKKKQDQKNKQQDKKQDKDQKQNKENNQSSNNQSSNNQSSNNQSSNNQSSNNQSSNNQSSNNQGQGEKDQSKDSQNKGKNDNKKEPSSQSNQQQGQEQEQEGKNKQDKDNKFSTAGTENQQQYADKTVEKALQKKAETKSEVPPAQASLSKDKLSPEERQSVENWLRRVPDDPGGLLRRKFLYQYQQRQQR